MTAVLDASAVLALVYGEPGAERVAEQLGDTVLSTVNYTEVLTKLLRDGHPAPRPALEHVVTLGVRLALYTIDTAARAAELWPHTRSAGLSLGDRACLATAATIPNAVALTTDRIWSRVEVGVQVQLIR